MKKTIIIPYEEQKDFKFNLFKSLQRFIKSKKEVVWITVVEYITFSKEVIWISCLKKKNNKFKILMIQYQKEDLSEKTLLDIEFNWVNQELKKICNDIEDIMYKKNSLENYNYNAFDVPDNGVDQYYK